MQVEKWAAYQGPNGWYVAFERDNGFHRQPSNGGSLTEHQARREALRRNQEIPSNV